MRHFKVISVMNYRERTIMLFGGPNELTKESFTVLEGFFSPVYASQYLMMKLSQGSVPFKDLKLNLWLNDMTNQEQFCWYIGPLGFQMVHVVCV